MPLQVYIASYGLVDHLEQVEAPENLFELAKPLFGNVFLTLDKSSLEALLEEVIVDYRSMRDEDEKPDLRWEYGEWTENESESPQPYVAHELFDDNRSVYDHSEGVERFGVSVAMLVIKRVDVAA